MPWLQLAGLAAGAYSAYRSRKAAEDAQRREIEGQHSANQANFQFQRESWENDRYNYKHRHQWEVDDLRSAGLNPILSAKFGGSSLPPSSAVPSAVNPRKGSTANRIQSMMTAKQISLVGAQINNIKADTQEKLARANTEGYRQNHLTAQVDYLIQQQKQSRAQTGQLVSQKQLNDIQIEILNVTKHYQKAKPYLDEVARLVKAGVSIVLIKKFLAKNGIHVLGKLGERGIKKMF